MTTSTFTPSKYQVRIFDWITNGTGNAIIDAVAGSGKTKTLVESAKLIGDKTGLFVAFNKHIADELGERLTGTPMVASTIHAMCKRVLDAHLGKPCNPNKGNSKWREIIDAEVERCGVEREKAFVWGDTLKKLISKVMVTLTPVDDDDKIWGLVNHFGMEDDVTPNMIKAVARAIRKAEGITRNTGAINFDEMIYWCVQWDLQPTKYDWVMCDECLPYLTPVQLADGTALPIGKIVEEKLPVTVLAYDTQTGEQRACRVTNWSKTLNRKPLVKIKAKWVQERKGYQPSNFVVCTVDHKIWANGQWLYAGDVKPGMMVQVETSAIKSHAYKITRAGRERLSAEMTMKNLEADLLGKRIGRTGGKITVRGGNGKGLTLPQQVLLEALGEGWQAEYAIATHKHKEGYPTAYKVDIAHPERRLAIEVDGASHQGKERQAQDAKKEALLQTLGWVVIRVSNRNAIQRTEEIVRYLNDCQDGHDCPVGAVVESVEPVEIEDHWVYDITVEDCHNFYANGILVHNCQDLNAMQLEMVLRSVSKEGRFIGVGDGRQALYGFAGADAESFATIQKRTNATKLPLSVNYRCPKSHLALVRDIVPYIEDGPNAIDGVVRTLDEKEMHTLAAPGDFVVCRLNAPLVGGCIQFIKNRKAARVLGRDIGKDLLNLLDKVMKDKSYSVIVEALEAYLREQVRLLSQKPDNEQKIQSITDRIECLQTCATEFSRSRSLSELKAEIEKLFGDEDDFKGVTFCTVHKAKGLEADRVFVLKPDKLPLKWKNQKAWQYTQELNIRYVALTRAKKELVLLGELPVLQPEQPVAVEELSVAPKFLDLPAPKAETPIEVKADKVVEETKEAAVAQPVVEKPVAQPIVEKPATQPVTMFPKQILCKDCGDNPVSAEGETCGRCKKIYKAHEKPVMQPAPKDDALRQIASSLTDTELDKLIALLVAIKEERKSA